MSKDVKRWIGLFGILAAMTVSAVVIAERLRDRGVRPFRTGHLPRDFQKRPDR